MSAFIGVDIGGTKTRIVRGHASGDAVDDVTVPSASWRGALGDVEADAAGLVGLLEAQFGDVVVDAAVAVGAHGCENTAQCRDVEGALRRRLIGPVRVVNDSELIAPAMSADAAIGVVVGTGSIASARDDRGRLVTAGGWGWILGDEGSAPALVRDAARAVLASLDEGHPLDRLGERLMTAFAVADGDGLALALTRAGSPDDWGRHAREVFAADDDGAPLAHGVIEDAGEQLARLVDRLLSRGIRSDAVVAGGSVIENQPRLQHALRDALARTRPGVALTILDRPPVLGALALARGLTRTHTTQNGDTLT